MGFKVLKKKKCAKSMIEHPLNNWIPSFPTLRGYILNRCNMYLTPKKKIVNNIMQHIWTFKEVNIIINIQQ